LLNGKEAVVDFDVSPPSSDPEHHVSRCYCVSSNNMAFNHIDRKDVGAMKLTAEQRHERICAVAKSGTRT
jgi:hypothetical protein